MANRHKTVEIIPEIIAVIVRINKIFGFTSVLPNAK